MSIISRSIKVFLFILGLITCVVLNARDRFNVIQILVLVIITFCFMIVTWVSEAMTSESIHLMQRFFRLLFL